MKEVEPEKSKNKDVEIPTESNVNLPSNPRPVQLLLGDSLKRRLVYEASKPRSRKAKINLSQN